MNATSACSWLGIEERTWPPDHYALLGLEPGESDLAVIEQHVLERLEKVRCHQLTRPEKATELMTLMACAFACLSNPQRKRAYDSALGLAISASGNGHGPPVAAAASPPPLADLLAPWKANRPGETPLPSGDINIQLDWTAEVLPPPVRSKSAYSVFVPAALASPEPATNDTDQGVASPRVEAQSPLDPSLEAARASDLARRGLGTSRSLLRRIVDTRELLWAWQEVGSYFKEDAPPLNRRTSPHFVKHMTLILEILQDFPRLLGRDGQPGYLVVSLARQQSLAITYELLQPSQRELLARDWRDGLAVLQAHRDFLRHELRALRRTNWWGLFVRMTRSLLADHTGKVLCVLALLALLAAYLNSPYDWGRTSKPVSNSTAVPANPSKPH